MCLGTTCVYKSEEVLKLSSMFALTQQVLQPAGQNLLTDIFISWSAIPLQLETNENKIKFLVRYTFQSEDFHCA